MPNPKLILHPAGLDAQFRLKTEDEEVEEGQIDSDDDDDDEEQEDCDTSDKQDTAADSQENGVSESGDAREADAKAKTAKDIARISLFEMQSFLIALILPEPRLSTPPSWCRVLRCMRAPNVGLFLLDNVDLDWIHNKGSRFTHAFKFEPAPNWIERLSSVPLSNRLREYTAPRELGAANGVFESNLHGRAKIPKTSLLLSPIQMIAENYPLPTAEGVSMLRSKYNPVDDDSPIFAIDCEMCITVDNMSELTRISIVDEEMRVVYNELVKPPNPITNYLTRYSGITKDMMKNVTTTLEDVQHFMRKNLPRDAIFCGHSLNSDLTALKLFHPYVIDTSVIYSRSGVRSQKPRLKTLAYELLGKEIQTSDAIGHDSLEDAVTAMELVKLKLVNGTLFGDPVAYELAQGIKFDHKTGLTHLEIDKFIERHDVTQLSYQSVDTTPGARCWYVHDKETPLEQEVKDTILHLLDRPNAICVILTSNGECYVKF